MLSCLFHILSGQTSNKEKWYIAHTRFKWYRCFVTLIKFST